MRRSPAKHRQCRDERLPLDSFPDRHSARLWDEPEPGRVLRERVLDDKGIVTLFTVDVVGDDVSDVTIETTWTPRGLGAFFERLAAPPFLRSVYAEELGNLEKVATGAL